MKVLAKIGDGLSTKMIADQLKVTPKTIEFHRVGMASKLNASPAQLVRIALAFGLSTLCLMLVAGCKTPPAPVPQPTPPPIPKAKVMASPLVAVAPASGSVVLAWDRSPSSGVGAYKLYQGTRSRSYSSTNTLGNVTNATILAIPDVTNYFAVTALGTSGGTVGESAFSNEAVFFSSQPNRLMATIISYTETSTNNQFNSWTTLAVYTNTFPGLPDPSFFRTRLSITITNSP